MEKTNDAPKGAIQKWSDRVKAFIVRFFKVFATMHLERAMLITSLAVSMGDVLYMDLAQVRACVLQVGGNETYCQKQGRRNPQVQDIMASINIWEEVIKNFFPVLYALFFCAWSDIYGRKFLIVSYVIGDLCRYIALLLCSYYPTTSASTVVLTSVLPIALSGGTITSYMAGVAYVADTTSIKDRTFRAGVMIGLKVIGNAAGFSLAGAFKDRFGSDYSPSFTIGGTMELLTLIYIIYFLQNTQKKSAKRRQGTLNVIKDMFNLDNIKQTFGTFWKKRGNGRRAQLICLFVILSTLRGQQFGESGTLHNFATSAQVGWNTADFAYFSSYTKISMFVGIAIVVAIFVKALKFTDATIGMISCSSNIASAVVYSFANGTALMYTAASLDLFGAALGIPFRSMLSKAVPRDELGKINAVVIIGESISAFGFSPLYALVYKLTSRTWAGAFFILTIALTLPALVIISWFRYKSVDYTEENEEIVGSESVDDNLEEDSHRNAAVGS